MCRNKQEKLDEVLKETEMFFSERPGLCVKGKCVIELDEGSRPVNLPVRRVPFKMRESVE